MKNSELSHEMMTNKKSMMKSIKKLHRAEYIAWTLFIGIGVAYTVLSLILPNNVG